MSQVAVTMFAPWSGADDLWGWTPRLCAAMAWLRERVFCAAEPYQWLSSERSPAVGAVLVSCLPEECRCVAEHRKS